MTATITICVMAHNLDCILVNIQMAIRISNTPIVLVASVAYSSPNILATICRCLGTRFNTLQNNPFTNHTSAISTLQI